jgi:UDP:flavonoid glycosyltransferase YjiC (YdhE family)
MAAALRSGVPQVPCPVMLDQPHNAQVVVRLGCAAGILPFGKLNARALSQLITTALAADATGNKIRRCAQLCGEQVRRESATSLDEYSNIIENYCAEFNRAKQRTVNTRNLSKPTDSLL